MFESLPLRHLTLRRGLQKSTDIDFFSLITDAWLTSSAAVVHSPPQAFCGDCGTDSWSRRSKNVVLFGDDDRCSVTPKSGRPSPAPNPTN